MRPWCFELRGFCSISKRHFCEPNYFTTLQRSFLFRRKFCSQPLPFTVLSFYKFKKIEYPDLVESLVRTNLDELDARGRIYINQIGINAQMCVPSSNLEKAKSVFSDGLSCDIDFRAQSSDFQVFNRLRVRVGKLLEGMDKDYDQSKSGHHVSPVTWNQMLDNKDENTVVVDVRNNYEWELGHFKDSIHPNLTRFSKFSEFAKRFSEEHGREKKVMMYCTGGIRCELFSGMLKDEGFDDVYQLEGGILNYGSQPDTHNWRGKMFVFDDRLVVPLSQLEDENQMISDCGHCGVPADTVYNCDNVVCNNIFIACNDCARKHRACCSEHCAQSCDSQFKARNKRQVTFKKTVGRGEHYRQTLNHIS